MVHHSKENALTDREFELFIEAADSLDEYYSIQCKFLIFTLGRLGMRRGEVAHMKEDWIDWRRNMITVPIQEDCNKGIDGSVCGYCTQLAKQKADYNSDISIQEALDSCWNAKTDAAARDIYWGYDARVKLNIERFFNRFNKWEWSSGAISRRVNRLEDNASEELSSKNIHPHALRATAATHHAARGLEMHALMQYFGWAQPSTAELYLSRNGQNTARQLDTIHS